MKDDYQSSSDILNLSPVYIPGLITPLHTEGAFGGVNHHMIHSNESGLLAIVEAYLNMQEGDWIELFWGDDDSPVASDRVVAGQVGEDFPMFIAAVRIPEGVNNLYSRVTRSGGGNGGESAPLAILVRTEFPGDTDPEPDMPGHQNLLPPRADLPSSGVIDEEAAKNGITVHIDAYPNMRQFDTITFSWGGELLKHLVTEAEVGIGVELLVTEETILAAGDSDTLVLVYRVLDEVHNQSSEWSMRTVVIVEVGEGLFESPVIRNPDDAAIPYDIIDLELLGDDDLIVEVYAERSGEMLQGDEVSLTWVGTTNLGQPVTVTPPPQTVPRVPSMLDFSIANADVQVLAHGRAVASFTVTRAGSVIGLSKRAFATFLGVEPRLPRPTVTDAAGDTLDPALTSTMVVIPGDALEVGDTVFLTWLGTRANGTPLLKEEQRGVSNGADGQPMLIMIAGDFIAPLDGGKVAVYYRLHKDKTDTELESEHLVLQVGEVGFELPAPTTVPAAVEGRLDPEDVPVQLEIVIAPWPAMQDGQTVYLTWNAAIGPDHDDYMPISEPMVGYNVVFRMDRALIEANLDQAIELAYRVESPGEPTRYSDAARFIIGPLEPAIPLPLPIILEAEGGWIDPDKVAGGATVSIDLSARFEENDEVLVKVIGNDEGGSTTITHKIASGEEGQALTLTIAYEVIAANAGTTFDLRYEITRDADGREESSDTVTYSVERETIPLPDPEILEAKGNLIDPVDVSSGATVSIGTGAQFEENDTVKIRVISNANGGSTTINHTIVAGEVGKPLTQIIPYPIIEANAGLSFKLRYDVTRANGGAVERSTSVTYSVASQVDSGAIRVMGARHSGNDRLASSTPRILCALHDSTSQPMRVEWRYEDEPDWAIATEWVDSKPGIKLYVRSRSETRECRPANVIGNGATDGYGMRSAFVAMRDETVPGNGKVDVVAWGDGKWGGTLSNAVDVADNIAELSANGFAFAARLRSATVLCWGHPNYGGSPAAVSGDFVEVKGTYSQFVGRKRDGVLQAWVGTRTILPVPARILQNRDYVSLHTAENAVAALRASGHVVAWGDATAGGALRPGQEQFNDIVQVASGSQAFVALRASGGSRHVIGWGNSDRGGLIPAEIANLANVRTIAASTQTAFCVLLETGQVKAWPRSSSQGGNMPQEVADLRNVVEVIANTHAFCARQSNGTVAAWGVATAGGQLPDHVAKKSNIVQVTASGGAFAALCSDGTVVAWGGATVGGDTAPVASKLVNVRAIYSNAHGFAAVTGDARVVTWGIPEYGGNSDAVQHLLNGRVTHSRLLSAAEAELVAGREVKEALAN